MKGTVRKLIVGIIILTIIVLSIFAVRFIAIVNNPLTITNDEMVLVNEGDNFYSIINKLAQENKIKSPIIIKIYTKLSNSKLEVLAGNHILTKDMSLNELIAALGENSDYDSISITIPEGFTIEDIAMKLEENSICSKEDFIKAVKEYPLPSYISDNEEKRYNLEGFLFPDTYNFEKNVLPQYIVETMLKRFEEVWNENAKDLNIEKDDIEDIITVASMIEKEAKVDEERPLVASVIYNRLNRGDMPLQICATVIYAHGYNIEDIRESHLAIDSKYNTYIHYGLPIGPISNPGVKSIAAALHPAETDYLFYLLEKDGQHYFTNDYQDFEQKKEEFGY